VEALRALAGEVHDDTRFVVDDRFPRDRVRALYAEWIAQSCAGDADQVLVLESPHGVSGYASCHLDGPDRGHLGLVGIAPSSRGAGLGRQLVDAALGWFAGRGVARVSVVTQGRNVGALRLYAACGFRPASVELWFHRWAASEPEGRR
jgi:dTDP-4-amino-4,6-dideoxy-D-galactose acyltransferase